MNIHPTLVVWDDLERVMTVKNIYIHEVRKGEYHLIEETNPDKHPVRTWHLIFQNGELNSVNLKIGKSKSRRFGKQNLSKCLRAYLLLLGFNSY